MNMEMSQLQVNYFYSLLTIKTTNQLIDKNQFYFTIFLFRRQTLILRVSSLINLKN